MIKGSKDIRYIKILVFLSRFKILLYRNFYISMDILIVVHPRYIIL